MTLSCCLFAGKSYNKSRTSPFIENPPMLMFYVPLLRYTESRLSSLTYAFVTIPLVFPCGNIFVSVGGGVLGGRGFQIIALYFFAFSNIYTMQTVV